MAYTLPRTMAFPAVRAFIVRVIAALEAAGFTDLGALWRTMKEKVSTSIASQAADEERESMTTAKVRVCDANWDQSVAELAKKALYLAGGNAKAAPYAPLFGIVKAGELQRLGPAKATVAAGTLLARIATLGNAELSAAAQDFATKTEALSVAEKDDAEAELKLASHAIERTKMIQELETLLAETEAKILTLNPGRADLVRAILNPKDERRSKRKTESTEIPVNPMDD
jgi:hypothetical protein